MLPWSSSSIELLDTDAKNVKNSGPFEAIPMKIAHKIPTKNVEYQPYADKFFNIFEYSDNVYMFIYLL